MLGPPKRELRRLTPKPFATSPMSSISLLPSALPTSKCSELHAFSIVTSANELATGWWTGRQLGLVKFLASAANSNGAWGRRAWGLEPRATPTRYCLHLTAWKLGDRPVLLSGTQTAMSLGWIANYLFSFCCVLPEKW